MSETNYFFKEVIVIQTKKEKFQIIGRKSKNIKLNINILKRNIKILKINIKILRMRIKILRINIKILKINI